MYVEIYTKASSIEVNVHINQVFNIIPNRSNRMKIQLSLSSLNREPQACLVKNSPALPRPDGIVASFLPVCKVQKMAEKK